MPLAEGLVPKPRFIKHQAGYFRREMIKNVHAEDQRKSEVMNSHSMNLGLHLPPWIPWFQPLPGFTEELELC